MATTTATSRVSPATAASTLRRLYLVRGAIAVLWAVSFAALSARLDVTVITLLVLYPLLDVVASLYDARHPSGAGQSRVQYLNAGLSTAALVGLAVTGAAGSTAGVLHVFGAWATVSGVVQLVVVLRRRSVLGLQWILLVSGVLSTLAGISFNVAASTDSPSLSIVAGYAGLGGVLFIANALVVGRRAKRVAHPA